MARAGGVSKGWPSPPLSLQYGRTQMSITLFGYGKSGDAARRLAGIAMRTPLLPAPWIHELMNGSSDNDEEGENGPLIQSENRLKCENLQHGVSFKIRGAYAMIAGLTESARRRGVITYSSGNHGQAVALAARAYGVPATVVMPRGAPRMMGGATERLGAEFMLEGC